MGKEDWEVLAPKEIPDPDDKKPDDWDDEEDGDWEAPMKDNPAYKGEWMVKRISNPEYKGIWEAKKIANPEYVDDDNLYKYDDVAEADAFSKKWKAVSEVEKAKK